MDNDTAIMIAVSLYGNIISKSSYSLIHTYNHAARRPPWLTKMDSYWESPTPDNCPFLQSTSLTRVYFTGLHSNYYCGDTWYPSWARDGNLYSPWTDGKTAGIKCGSWGGEDCETGHAVMIGDDPLRLTIRNTSKPKRGNSLPYDGRYPSASLVYNGIWYYGTYCVGPEGNHTHKGFVWNWANLGPVPGFQIS